MLPSSTENREANDKDEAPSTASTKPRASDASPPGPLQSPAAIADGEPPAATADRNLAAENAEVEAILDAWARGPPTPPSNWNSDARSSAPAARATRGIRRRRELMSIAPPPGI